MRCECGWGMTAMGWVCGVDGYGRVEGRQTPWREGSEPLSRATFQQMFVPPTRANIAHKFAPGTHQPHTHMCVTHKHIQHTNSCTNLRVRQQNEQENGLK